MPRNICCVPGCSVVAEDGVPLHYFPNPEKYTERFLHWVKIVGGGIENLDYTTIHKTKRICHRHFQKEFLYPKNRLCKLAVPSLFLAAEEHSAANILLPQPSTSTQEPMLINPVQVIPSLVSDDIQNNSCDLEPTTSLLDSCTCKTPTLARHPSAASVTARAIDYKQNSSVTQLQRKHDENEVKRLELKLRNALKAKLAYRKRYLLAKKVAKSRAFQLLTKKFTPASKALFYMQIKGSGLQPRGRRFSINEKILALSLYKPSPKAYRMLSQICVLPSRRTLQNVLQQVKLMPGINDNIFKHLERKVARMPEKHKFCCILFDEMSIATNLTYDEGHDSITGFLDNGTKREPIFSDHALVFMIRGIVKKYKQPIAYSFCSGSTRTVDLKLQILNIIEKVLSTGLRVIATVCDQGTTNQAAINQLLEHTKAEYLRKKQNYTGGFFEVGGIKITPIYDPPHLMKGVRNNLLNKNLKYVLDGKVRIAKWSHIEDLFLRSPSFRGVKLVHKLTAQHVMPKMIPKMRVKYCTQVFSKTVGVTLGCMAESGSLPQESVDTAELLLLFDDLFDSVNANCHKEDGKIYRTAVTSKSPHLELWNKMLPILKSMRFLRPDGKEIIVPSLTSWVKTIEGFKIITSILKSGGVNSLLPRNINQDPLENFFGAIRAHGCSNIMPDCTAFETAFKTLLINNITSVHSVQGNCEQDDSICLQSLKSFITQKENTNTCSNNKKDIEIKEEHLNIELIDVQNLLSVHSRSNVEKCAAIAYCSGWIAYKARKFIFKKCKTCESNLISNNRESFHNFIVKKEYRGKLWLCYPTLALFNLFAQIEHITNHVLEIYPHMENIRQYIVLIVTVHIDTNFLNCSEHKQTLSNYLVQKSVVFFIMNWCKEVSNVLTGKSYFNYCSIDSCGSNGMFLKARQYYNKNKGRRRTTQKLKC